MSLMGFGYVLSETTSGPASFIAEVAGADNSLEMVCLNVIFNGTGVAFLSTDFAKASKTLTTA